MASFHTQIKMHKYDFKDSQLTVKLASGITAADVGKALTQDTTADNTMKLCGSGEVIDGILYTFEDRVNEGTRLGTCEFQFAAQLPIKSGLAGAQIVVRGSRLCGALAGEVRAIDPATDVAVLREWANAPRVWAVTGLLASSTKIN